MREFISLEKIDELNAFEKCLAVIAFWNVDEEVAVSINELIQMKAKLSELDSN